MIAYKNNTSTTVILPSTQSIRYITNMIITNKTIGSITLNIYISTGGLDICICPKDLTLAAGESYVDKNIVIMNGDRLKIVPSGSIDYYVSINE